MAGRFRRLHRGNQWGVDYWTVEKGASATEWVFDPSAEGAYFAEVKFNDGTTGTYSITGNARSVSISDHGKRYATRTIDYAVDLLVHGHHARIPVGEALINPETIRIQRRFGGE